VAFLRSLPLEVKQEITGEESEIFMYEEDIPESLYEKIKDYITEGFLEKLKAANSLIFSY